MAEPSQFTIDTGRGYSLSGQASIDTDNGPAKLDIVLTRADGQPFASGQQEFAVTLSLDEDLALAPDPYRLRQLPPAELDQRKRELQADLPLYPAGTNTRLELAGRIAAIDAELDARKKGEQVNVRSAGQ